MEYFVLDEMKNAWWSRAVLGFLTLAWQWLGTQLTFFTVLPILELTLTDSTLTTNSSKAINKLQQKW